MTELTRRGFLAQTSIAAGIAIAGGVALRQLGSPSIHSGPSKGEAAGITPVEAQPAMAQDDLAFIGAPLAGVGVQEPLVVHVRNATAGEMSLMVGTQELVYRDPDLVARLVRTANSAGRVEG
jgi:hypothetical protein